MLVDSPKLEGSSPKWKGTIFGGTVCNVQMLGQLENRMMKTVRTLASLEIQLEKYYL